MEEPKDSPKSNVSKMPTETQKIKAAVSHKDSLLAAEARMTNTEFVTSLMEFSPVGSLSQAFVIEAIRSYSNIVADLGRPVDEDGALFSKRAWYDCAVDFKMRVSNKYKDASK